MNHFNVDLLNTVGIAKVRYADFYVGHAVHFTAIFTGQGDHFHPLRTRRFNRFNDVGRVAGSGDPQQYIPRTPYRFNIAREDKIVAKIVADAGEVADI